MAYHYEYFLCLSECFGIISHVIKIMSARLMQLRVCMCMYVCVTIAAYLIHL